MNRYKLIIAVLAIAIVILGVPRLLLVPYLEREFESELAASLQAVRVGRGTDTLGLGTCDDPTPGSYRL